jgi:anti-sigma factor RsiW
MSEPWRVSDHPSDLELARLIDGRVAGEERDALHRHIAACGECRADFASAGRVVTMAPPRRLWPIMVPAAAAAAALLLVWMSPAARQGPDEHRAPTLTESAPPALIGPVGRVALPLAMQWHPVPYADEYRVTLYGADGGAIWETVTADTAAVLPHALELAPGGSYFWRLEARLGRDRWVVSDLTEFIPTGR